MLHRDRYYNTGFTFFSILFIKLKEIHLTAWLLQIFLVGAPMSATKLLQLTQNVAAHVVTNLGTSTTLLLLQH